MGPLASGRRLKKAFETGDLNEGVLTIGQISGIIHDVLPVKTIMDDMMEECFSCIDRFADS